VAAESACQAAVKALASVRWDLGLARSVGGVLRFYMTRAASMVAAIIDSHRR
jgi:hypothetical protein